MNLVELTPLEIVQAAHLAGVIRGVKKVQASAGALSNRRVAVMDDFGMHYLGMLGEVAVSKVLGTPVRSDVTTFGDGMVDMTFRGESIQIKTSSHASLKQKRMVFLNGMHEFRSDWLICCSLQSASSIGIHGFISRRRFEKKMFHHNFGYGDRVCVYEDDLAPIERIFDAIKGSPVSIQNCSEVA